MSASRVFAAAVVLSAMVLGAMVPGLLRATDLAPGGPVVLSEIMYNPPDDFGADDLYEYVELHNRGAEAVDVSGWRLKDKSEEHTFVLPVNTVIPAGGYLAVARNAVALRAAYGAEVAAVGDLSFPLDNGGDTVRLLNRSGELVDRVEFDDDLPWPREADGRFSSLERIALADDITDFTHFAPSQPGPLPGTRVPGTPGAPNSRAGEIPARHSVIFNEVMYNPVKDPAGVPRRHCPGEEFIELFNRGSTAADLSGWQLALGVDFTFPAGTVLDPGGYLAVYHDEASFRAKYGDAPRAAGPYAKDLDNGGGALLLVDQSGLPADYVDYGDAPPWPVNPDGLKGSIELVDPASDNGRGRAWRESASFLGTPGARNSAAMEFEAAGGNAGPQITGVAVYPASDPARREIHSTDEVRVEARVLDQDGVSRVRLEFQIVPPGGYIARTDPRFETEWTPVAMAVDPERAVYAATLPAVPHRTLMRYRIVAADAAPAPRGPLDARFPWPGDPEPNVAYFVYDGAPDYVANQRSLFGPAGYVHRNLEKVPVYHLIGAAADIEALLYQPLPPSEDNVYHWRVTFVHQDGVHDHCGIRLRGENSSRYGAPRRSLKVRFNKGNYFRGRSNDGSPYPNRRSKTNFMREHVLRGEGGAIEALAWKLYRDADVLVVGTTFVHLRMVRANEESDQFDGDFFGLFLETQQLDKSALKDQGRPVDEASSLYKFEGSPLKRHPDCDPSTLDVRAFQTGTAQARTREYFEQNLDVPRYLSFRVATELADNHDMDSLKNFYYYFNSATRRWEVAPWDLDHALGGDASGDEPLRVKVLGLFPIEFRNRFRFVWQLHYDAKRLNGIVDGWTAMLQELADADQDRWDIEPREACPNWPNPGGQCRTYTRFDARMRELKLWLRNRAVFSQTSFRDVSVPHTPRNELPFAGAAPAPPVRLRSSAFADPEGDSHVQTRWMVIERGGDWAYPLWDFVTATGLLEVEVPAELTPAGSEYLFRVGHMDATGRWGFMSEPTSFRIGVIDRTPPTPPGPPQVEHLGSRSVVLRWAASQDPESGILGYRVLRDGQFIDRIPVLADPYADFGPVAGSRHEYRVVAVNTAGLESAPSAAAVVDVPSGGLGGWDPPAAGWEYLFEARPGEDAYVDPRLSPTLDYLDGTWRRSSLSEWDGSRPGQAGGAPGGAAIEILPGEAEDGGLTSVLSLEDPGDPSPAFMPPNNRRLMFLHAAGDANPFDQGITLIARLRVNPAPRDLPGPKGQTPDPTTFRGQLGIAYRGPTARAHFSLWLDERGLVTVSGDSIAVTEAEIVRFQSLWVILERADDKHRLRVFRNGGTTPAIDSLITLPASGTEASVEGGYLEMGLSNTADSGAIQVDYFGYKSGVVLPVAEGQGGAEFVRGDVNADGRLSQADPLLLLHYLFGEGTMDCADAADANDSGRLNLADAVLLLERLFGMAGPLAPPSAGCGPDPNTDSLAPCRYALCAGGD